MTPNEQILLKQVLVLEKIVESLDKSNKAKDEIIKELFEMTTKPTLDHSKAFNKANEIYGSIYFKKDNE